MEDIYAYPFQANDKQNPGMTLRDYFAGQAVTGLVAQCSDSYKEMLKEDWAMSVREAYALADAMLEERNK